MVIIDPNLTGNGYMYDDVEHNSNNYDSYNIEQSRIETIPIDLNPISEANQ